MAGNSVKGVREDDAVDEHTVILPSMKDNDAVGVRGGTDETSDDEGGDEEEWKLGPAVYARERPGSTEKKEVSESIPISLWRRDSNGDWHWKDGERRLKSRSSSSSLIDKGEAASATGEYQSERCS